MGDAFAIEMTELRKTYDGAEALRGLSLQVPSGSKVPVTFRRAGTLR